jgi:Zn-dependent peptidase ImmA (M78 family)
VTDVIIEFNEYAAACRARNRNQRPELGRLTMFEQRETPWTFTARPFSSPAPPGTKAAPLPVTCSPAAGTYAPSSATTPPRRRAWGLGDAPIVNMLHVLEAHGVRVFSLARDYETVDSLSFWRDDVPVVFLNPGKTGERGRFDAAHELGHLVLHRGEWTPGCVKDAEKEANQFASAFLMPIRSVIAAGHLSTPPDILRVKKRWKVAAVALVYRLHELDLLTDWRRRDLLIQLTQMGYRSAEPGASNASRRSCWRRSLMPSKTSRQRSSRSPVRSGSA